MKKIISSIQCCHRQTFAHKHLLLVLIIGGLFATGCKKDASVLEEQSTTIENKTALGRGNILDMYTGIPPRTAWELQQARAHTARYQKIENAVNDGYEDIAVVVEEMGHHYMKLSLVDAEFDFKKPELLVYSRDHDGNFQLVAVEYAVPIPLSANAPEGFSGNLDVWDYNMTFGLWLLHAWVWEYNPLGVFNPTNPNVHTH